ncbi:MAG: MerR family transcriptional regulator [Cellulosilyticaceae bacterium]
MKSLLSIGEVSQITHLTIQTLRHYHRIGLLVPKYIDPQSGYRYYSLDQLVYIDIIKTCKSLGTSLADLKQLFEEKDMHTLLSFLQTQKQAALDTMTSLQETITNIDHISEAIHHSAHILSDPTIQTKHLPERWAVTLPCNNVSNLNVLIDYSKVNELIKQNNYIPDIESGTIYTINNLYEIVPTHVFGTIKYGNDLLKSSSLRCIPAGTFLCISYTQVTEKEQMTHLLTYLKVNNIQVKQVIESNLLTYLFQPDTYSCELQVQIK